MNNQKILQEILNGDNVVEKIKNNLSVLIELIPEIAAMIGFAHKHPHHHLDVWEHTLCALSFSSNNFDVRLVLLLHDIGKPYSYQEGEVRHFKGHPKVSAKIAEDVLKRLGYETEYVTYICELISRHDTALTEEDIRRDMALSKRIFEVQKCDTMAHNPATNERRWEYLDEVMRVFQSLAKDI